MLTPCTNEWAERLSAFLDNELTPYVRKQVEEHLAGCEACRTWVALSRCDVQDTAAALQVKTSEGFAAQVMAQLAVTPLEGTPEPKITREALIPTRPPFGGRIWEGLLVLVVLAILGSVMFPVFSKAREKARQPACANNQRQLMTAIQMWTQDHQERLPDADRWLDEVSVDPGVLKCPSATRLDVAYAYNSELSNRYLGDFSDAAGTIATFDAKDGQPAYRHGNKMIASYLDGHVDLVADPQHQQADGMRRMAMEAQKPPTQSAPPPGPPPLAPAMDLKRPAPIQKDGAKQPTIAPPVKNYGLADKLQIAYKANIGLECPDVQLGLERAELLFRQYDGFVLASDYQRSAEGVATASVSGRVPAAQLGEMLVKLGALGTLTARTVNGEDLTAAHLEQLEKMLVLTGSQGRLDDIATRSRNTSEGLTVERHWENRAQDTAGTRIEAYKLKSKVTLAEVSVTLTNPPKTVEPAKEETLGDNVQQSLAALLGFGRWLLSVLIPLGIFLPVWGPLLWGGIVLWRRYRLK